MAITICRLVTKNRPLYKIKNTEDPFTTISLFNNSALNTSITGLGEFTEYEFHVLVLTVNDYRPVSPVKVVRTSGDGKTIPFVNWKV